MKRRIRLSESSLHRIIKESVKRTLNEWGEQPQQNSYEQEENQKRKMVQQMNYTISQVEQFIKLARDNFEHGMLGKAKENLLWISKNGLSDGIMNMFPGNKEYYLPTNEYLRQQ